MADIPPHCDLLVADGGELTTDPATRADRLRTADNLVRDLLARPDHGTVVLAGIADTLNAEGRPAAAELTALSVQPAGSAIDPGHRPWLCSPSTHRRGLVQLPDLTPTLLRRVPAGLTGGVLGMRGSGASNADLLAAADAARAIRDMFVPFFVAFAVAQLVLFPIAWVTRRRAAARRLGLWFAAVAPASFVVNLLPWPYWRHPTWVLWIGTLIGATGLAVFADLRRWRRPYLPAAIIGALTAAGLALDVATGSGDQTDALFGLSPLIAGRFYGLGNITFAVYAGCVLVAAAGVARAVGRRHGRRAAGQAAAVVGLVAALIDGWPGLGTDFGGFLSLLPGTAVLALGIAGIRLRPRVLALTAAVTAGLIGGLALLDWRRPADRRTHLGRFVQQIADGNGLSELHRKLDANLGLLHNPATAALLVLGLAVLVPTMLAPHRLRLHRLAHLQAADPVFRGLMRALVVTGLLGFALNDSGVIVPSVMLATGGPLVACVRSGLGVGRG